MVQRARGHALRRLRHDDHHRRFDAIKQPGQPRHVPPGQIQPRQQHQNGQRWQHEQQPGHHAAPGAVHQPAQIGGQLLGFRARQQHAIVQRMQKTPLRNPAPPHHQLLVHQRDLPGRPAKADPAQPEPEPQCLGHRHHSRRGSQIRSHPRQPPQQASIQKPGSLAQNREPNMTHPGGGPESALHPRHDFVRLQNF